LCCGVGGRGACFWLLGGGGGGGGGNMARGATWWWSFCRRRLRHDDIQKAPPRKQNETSPDSDCFTCTRTRTTRANPNRHFPESKDEIWVSNRHLGAIPDFGAGHEINKLQPRSLFAMWTCWLGSQPPCRSRVAGRRAHRTTPFPHTVLLAFD
jgi:hypothetical protein